MLKHPGPQHEPCHALPAGISVAFEGAGTGYIHSVAEYPPQQNVFSGAGGVAQR